MIVRWKERLRPLAAPVLKQPVFLVESDDWGPGDPVQAEVLRAVAGVLERHRDAAGHPARMTIGVVLSVPDARRIAATGDYHARFLDEPEYRTIVDALQEGVSRGVFDLQLHGLAHYWPDNLMALWRREEAFRRRLAEAGWRTEKLPAWLQSRWIDAVDGLPSRPLDRSVIRRAVREEVEVFRRCFGYPPKVAVPPTFVWDGNVEAAYAEAGIEVLITPGRRYPGRDGAGRLTPPERGYHNGEALSSGLTALVRDVYFEPALGHTPDGVLTAVERKWRRREPVLLETHRFNFLDGNLEASLDALDRLLQRVRARFPQVCFLSSRQLAGSMTELSDPSLVARLRTLWPRWRG